MKPGDRLGHQVAQRPPRRGALAHRRGGDPELRHLQHRRPVVGAEAAHHRRHLRVGDAGPPRHRDPRQLDHPLRLAPALQAHGSVRPHHEHQLAVPAFLGKQLQGLIRVGRPLALDLERGDREARVVGGGEPGHRQPQLFAGVVGDPLVRRLAGRDQHHLGQAELPERLLGERQVAEVRRVERRPEHADRPARAGGATHAPGRRRGRRT